MVKIGFDILGERLGAVHHTPDLPAGIPGADDGDIERQGSHATVSTRTKAELAKAAQSPQPGVESPPPEPGYYL